MRKIWLSCFLLLTFLAASVQPLRAQDVPVDDGITTRQPLADQINDLRQTYRQQLEEYRTMAHQQEVANEQYTKLGTLVSLESAVTATRNAMLSRAKVLQTYLTLLRLELADAPGINLELKNTSLSRLDALLSELAVHQQQIESASDRQAVTQLTTDFEILAEQIEDIAYQAQTLLTIGRLQNVYDKTQAVGEEVRQTATVSGELRQAERDRAYNEIQTKLMQVKTVLDTVTQDTQERSKFSRTSLSGLSRDLNEIYAGLSQTLSFLNEYLRL